MNITEIIAIAGGVYETLSRIIPTKKSWSIVHGVLKFVLNVSGFLNREKPGINQKIVKDKNFYQNLSIVFIIATLAFSCKSIKETQVDCLSKKTVHVTLISKKGDFYTIHVPYCDSILVQSLADTVNLKQHDN